MASSSQKVVATFLPQIAEAVAIRQGLQLARDTCIYPITVESDAEVVVDWIKKGNHSVSNVCLIISDISALVQGLSCDSVNSVPKKGNQVAHLLAKNGLAIDEDCFWIEDYPPCIRHFVLAECHNSI